MEAEEIWLKEGFPEERHLSQMWTIGKDFLENDGSGGLGALSRQKSTYKGKQARKNKIKK